jgi:hypothetical protein
MQDDYYFGSKSKKMQPTSQIYFILAVFFECYPKNKIKFENLVHLFGFTIETYCDGARSYERYYYYYYYY